MTNIGLPATFFANLQNFGSVKGSIPRRRIEPIRLWGESKDGLFLKAYVIYEEGNGLFPGKADIVDAWTLVDRERSSGRLTPLSGFGFAILSPGVLNVCRWDTKYIDVPVPRIYVEERGIWRQKPVEEVGAFCSGEKRVYDHEHPIWLTFCASGKTPADMKEYLENFLSPTEYF